MNRLAVLLFVTGCAAATPASTAVPPTQRCPQGQTYDGRGCRAFDSRRASLERGAAELEAFHPDEAVTHFLRAAREGPYRHQDHVRLYEQLGVAYAYLEDEAKALEAFNRVLTLSPGHAISYTLSPKATFVFERARELAARRRPPDLRVTWPRDALVDEPLPLELEIASDPAGELAWARLFYRLEGEPSFRHADVPLAPKGAYTTVELPPLSPDAEEAASVQVHAIVHDRGGNEVLRWATEEQPQPIPLGYRPEPSWYERWWVWGAGAVVLGTAAAIIAVAATQPESETLEGQFSRVR